MKIGALAKATATKVETVRYYELSGLLPAPARTESNYRQYGSEHLARLAFIRRARDLGFTISSVRELLSFADNREMPCSAIDSLASSHLAEVKRKIADLTSLRKELSRMIGCSRHGTVAECNIVESLASKWQQIPVHSDCCGD